MAFFPFSNTQDSCAAATFARVGTSPFRSGPPSSTPRPGRSSSSSTSSATRPSPWPVRDDQAGAHARQHRRRHRPAAERGDAEAHGGVDRFAPRLPPLPRAGTAPGIALPAAILDRYVGEYKAASGFTATFRREGDKLFVKPGDNPEAPLSRGQRRASRIRGTLLRVPARRPGQGDRRRSGARSQGTQNPAGAEIGREPERVARAVSVRIQRAGVGPRAT